MYDLRTLAEVESRTRDSLEAIKRQILREVKAAKEEGIKNLNAHCALVSLSTIRGFGMILAPEYYLQDKQAELVSAAISRDNTALRLIASLEEMVQKGYVRYCGTNQRLNNTTLGILNRVLENL